MLKQLTFQKRIKIIFFVLTALFVILFGFKSNNIFDKKVQILFDNDEFSLNEEVSEKFYDKYNQWSYESSTKPIYFGFDLNENISGFVDLNNQKIRQFSFTYKDTSEPPNLKVSILNFYGNEVYTLKYSEIKEDQYIIIYDDVLFIKNHKKNKISVHILNLSLKEKFYSILNPHFSMPHIKEQ